MEINVKTMFSRKSKMCSQPIWYTASMDKAHILYLDASFMESILASIVNFQHNQLQYSPDNLALANLHILDNLHNC